MLKTVPIDELQSGDKLNTGDPATVAEEALPEEVRNARLMVRDAMAIPHSMPELFTRASTVRRFHKSGTIYAHVVMDSGAVVSLRKGSPVSVYRNDANSAQDAAPAVLEHIPECASYLSDDVTGESYVCDCSVGNGVRITHTVQASTVGNITYPAMVETLPAETEEIPYGPERQPFNYIRAEFGKLPKRAEHYRMKITADDSETGQTRWLTVHPEDLPKIRAIMEAREENS